MKRNSLEALKQELIDKQGSVCAICGAVAQPHALQLDHIVPRKDGGEDDVSNLRLACARCNAEIADGRGFRETDFVAFLADLLSRHPEFSDVVVGAEVGRVEGTRFVSDLTASRSVRASRQRLVIECKGFSAMSKPRVVAAIEQLRRYAEVSPDAGFVLALPGRISERDRELLGQSKFELWDADFISEKFGSQIETSEHPLFKTVFSKPVVRLSRQGKLLAALKACKPGREECLVYQRLVGQILEELFCPALRPPLSESGDLAGANRRDFVLPNYAESGFWRFVRERYGADYVVVDAKNYAKSVKKKDVLQMANYLKAQGTGLFGIIFSRNGPDRNAALTAREQWLLYGKLVLFVDDDSVETMLLASSSGADPTTVLGDVIQSFRLSI